MADIRINPEDAHNERQEAFEKARKARKPNGGDHPHDVGVREPSSDLVKTYEYVPRYGEDKLAQKVVERHGEFIRYVEIWGKWFIWTGCVWAEDDKSEIIDKFVREICWEIADQLVREDPKRNERLAAKLVSSASIHAVKKLTGSIAPVAATKDQWDEDDWLC